MADKRVGRLRRLAKQFEKYVILYGKQACMPAAHQTRQFEKYVILYGKQAADPVQESGYRFEKYVILYGKQACTAPPGKHDQV